MAGATERHARAIAQSPVPSPKDMLRLDPRTEIGRMKSKGGEFDAAAAKKV
jgi:hypothetical protein